MPKAFDDLHSISTTIRIKLDTGEVREFRSGRIDRILRIPERDSELRRELAKNASRIAFWSYYAEIYKSIHEQARARYEEHREKHMRYIELAIKTDEGEHGGVDYATDRNINGVYYSDPQVIEMRESLERKRRKAALVKAVADALKDKSWNLRVLLSQSRAAVRDE